MTEKSNSPLTTAQLARLQREALESGDGRFSHLFSEDAHAVRDVVLEAKFATGNGVLQLDGAMSDQALAATVRWALKASAGAPFQVVHGTV